MPYCSNCGFQVDQDDRFCHNCSKQLNTPERSTEHVYNTASIISTSLLILWTVFQSIGFYLDGYRGGFTFLFAGLLVIVFVFFLLKPNRYIQIGLMVVIALLLIPSALTLFAYIVGSSAEPYMRLIWIVNFILSTLSFIFLLQTLVKGRRKTQK